ncbi:hypothetical protein [Bacillus toyonensis]|uniref:hypothetical protein n=1 Tax=Bacillus toyonensis TaxID=155322 RepID=UPI002E1F1993|nr:hypothetical protein [Bacillus toyonensis]
MKKFTQFLKMFTIYSVHKLERLISWFKKDVYIKINTCYSSHLNTNVKDSFNIYIGYHNKYRLLSNVDWVEAERIVSILRESNRTNIELSHTSGSFTEYILIPRWARSILANKIEENIEPLDRPYNSVSLEKQKDIS